MAGRIGNRGEVKSVKLSKVAIRTDGTITAVTVDGVDVSKRATRVCFEHTAGEIPIVTITLPVDEFTADGSVGVVINNGRAGDDDTTNALMNTGHL